jgi:hypothetical protein
VRGIGGDEQNERCPVVRCLFAGLALALLAGCSGGRTVYGCMPDGSPVFYQYKNTAGTYEGAKASPENCRQAG